MIKPFAAVRPRADCAGKICELPYDVVSTLEARAIAASNRLSFFHVSKPEIDLPDGTDPHAPVVYERGREYFHRLMAEGMLQQDPEPAFHLYRQIMGAHTQTGLVAVASCDEYRRNVIRKHELTRIEKEDDRLRHIEALDAQTGPAFLIHPAEPELTRFVRQQTEAEPALDFVAADGVRHTAWTVGEPDRLAWLQKVFVRMPALYIADGHHRSAAASRVDLKRNGAGASGWFLVVIFPHDQLQILPYNRVLKDLNGHSPEQLLKRLSTVFAVDDGTGAEPAAKHELGFYFQGRWRRLTFRPECVAPGDPSQNLDVALLQSCVLAPIFGIADPRTSERIIFVGGIRGLGELERMVDSRAHACAFSMFPTSVEDLMAVADAGGIMPPKSTWFEPKLRDGMFSHLLA